MSERRRRFTGRIILGIAALGMIASSLEFVGAKGSSQNWLLPATQDTALAWIFLAVAVFEVVYAKLWLPTSRPLGAMIGLLGVAVILAGPIAEGHLFPCLPRIGFLICTRFSSAYSLRNDVAFLAWSSLVLGALLVAWGVAKGRLWELAHIGGASTNA